MFFIWAFYINLCIGAAAAPIYLFLLPNKDPRPGVPFLERIKEMDFVGCILAIGAFVSGTMAINWGGITYPWSSGRIIALFVVSGVLFIILGFQQVYLIFTTVERRLIPVEFFYSRTVLILFSATAASGAAAFVPIYMIPIFFQFTRNDTALGAGVRLLPFISLLVFTIFVNGALMAKFGYYMVRLPPFFPLRYSLASQVSCFTDARMIFTNSLTAMVYCRRTTRRCRRRTAIHC